MNIFEALGEVSKSRPIIVILDNPDQFEEFVKLTAVNESERKENQVKIFFKMFGQKVMIGSGLGE